MAASSSDAAVMRAGKLGCGRRDRYTDPVLALTFSRIARQPARNPRIRADTLTGYAGLARSVGLDPASLVAGVGLQPTDLDVPGRWIPAAPAARLLELSAAQSGCADFGLRMAALRRLGTLGPLSVVLRDEPDLRSALVLLVRYERVYNEALRLHLGENGGEATIEAWLEFGEPAPAEQALDLVMGALLGIVRMLVRSDWQPRSACFARAAPADPAPWRALFGPDVAFGCAFTGLVLPVTELDAAIVTADSSLRPYTHRFLLTLGAPESPGVPGVADVAAVVEVLLPLGRTSVDQVSRNLGLSTRDLQRHLADRGETFSSILHSTRAGLAERYLSDDRYSLTTVSQLLGFEAPSAFSRWFRQRFGTSPMTWRRAAREDRTVRGG
jgi:AraC-like DNA-binding protein